MGQRHLYDSYDRMWEEEERAAEARRRRWRYLGVVLALWVVAFWVLGYYGVQKWRSRQARLLAISAATFASEGHLRDAELRAITALQMRPDEPQVLRSTARVFDFMGNPQAVGLYEKLAAMPEASAEDRKRSVQAAIRFGQTAVAEREAAVLENSGDPGFARLVKANQLLARRDARGAEKELRAIADGSEARMPAELQLANLLAARGTDEAQAESLGIFRALSSRGENTGLDALASALSAGVVPPDEVAGWAQRLMDHPLANDRTFLVAQRARIQAEPGMQEAAVKAVMARFADAPVERKAAAVFWLNGWKEFPRSLELLPQSEAVTNRDAFVLWLDALAGTGDWATADAALSSNAQPLSGSLAELFRARAARMTGREGTSQQGYRRAVQLALSDPRELAVAEAFLDADGQNEIWVSGMRQALHNPTTAATAKEGLVTAAKRTCDAAKLGEVYRLLAGEFPEDAGARDALYYYSLVLGQKGLLDQVREHAAKKPADFARKALLALALLKENRAEEAVRVFDGLQVRSDQITPEQKAIVVSVLAANRRMDQAEAMAMTLGEAQLTAQEAGMVNGYLREGAMPQEAPKP